MRTIVIDRLPTCAEVYEDHESMDAVVIKVPKKWWESLSFEKTPETKRCSKDTISRQAAIDAINTWDKFGVDERNRVVRWYEGLEPYVHLRDVVTAIVNLPSAETEPSEIARDIATIIENEMDMRVVLKNAQPERKKGKWVDDVAYYDEEGCPCIVTRCNQCGEVSPISRFCSNCGADMRGEKE